MALTELPAHTTPISVAEAAKALASAYRSVTGKSTSYAILSLLVGMWAVETAIGEKIWNYNFGNTMPTSSDKYFQYLNASEVIDGVNTPMREKFAAYKSLSDGATAFIKVLKSRAHWWNGLQSGNTSSFITGLKTSPAYFTGSGPSYLSQMNKHISTYSSTIKKYASSFWGTALQTLLGVGLGLSGIYTVRKIYHASRTS